MLIRYNFELELWISIVVVLDSINKNIFWSVIKQRDKCNQRVK